MPVGAAIALGTVAVGAISANKASSASRAASAASSASNAANAAASIEIAKEQSAQLDKQIAFEKSQLEADRAIQLENIDTQKMFAERAFAAAKEQQEIDNENAKRQTEALQAQARATDAAAAAQSTAAILGKPDYKELALPVLIGLYLYFRSKK